MLSIATATPLSFAGAGAIASWSRASGIHMVDPPPVFSEVDEESKIYYRTPSETTESFNPNTFAQTLPGISAPLGFFDPAGFCSADNGAEGAATEGKVRFYREVEIKHCRIAMLAAVGFPLAEQFHPLFGGGIDTPSFSAFQQTPLQTFWPAVVLAIAAIEVLSIIPAFENPNVEGWAIRTDHTPGDLGFDPLNLKPKDQAELSEMQTKELNNGRLAMIAIAGMVVQEGVTGAKLFA
jgi:light-harvesting complex I chlorophyll a/b binding protein 4